MIKLEGGQSTERGQPPFTDGNPLVSIITVAYNAQDYIHQAIESVLSQTYPNVEYIIIDGASTDGTLDIIRDYGDAINHLISEPDDGIYHAMNKGIALASGEIIGLVNADDVIYPDTVAQVVTALTQKPDAGFTMAPVDLASDDGAVFGAASPLTDAQLPERMWRGMPCPHQGIYVRSSVYQALGGFEEKYQLRSDYDFLLRMLRYNIPFVRLDEPVGFFRSGGQSGGISTWLETRRLLSDYGRPRLEIEWGFLSSVFKTILSKILPYPIFKIVKRLNKQSRRKLY